VGALGVVVFVVALLLSIALHELGHLATAKRFGMKASRYFIGMGPTLWSTWRGETEYGVKAFPVGGFVKIVGMTQYDELEDPRDEPRAFWRQPAPQRAVVLAAGSATHFLIAFVLLLGATLGFAQPKPTTRIGTVSDCLQDDPKASCAERPPSPAKAAGIRPGDRVVAFEGREITSWEQFSNATHAHPTGPAEVVVERDGQRIPLRVTVQRITTTIDGRTEEQGRIGVTVGEETERLGPARAVGRAGTAFWELTTGSVKALGEIPSKLPTLFRDAATNKPRAVDDGAPVSVVDLGRFSAQAFDSGHFVELLGMIAALNVFIGIFNLLPLLPLDGGHLAILVFERVRSRLARAFGRRDPGRVDVRKLMPATLGFIVVMGSLTLVLLYAGITNPIANPFSGP
jgi:membrane-associated protease RseP (regulator of RpoE activity)